MRKFLLFLLFVLVSFALANPADERSKIVFVSLLKAPAEPFYIGQKVQIIYKAMLFGDAKILNVLNAHEAHGASMLGNFRVVESAPTEFEISAFYKLTAPNFKLPPIIVEVESENYRESALSQEFSSDAIDLSSNPNFSGVLAQKMLIKRRESIEYDSDNNIIVMEIEATDGNARANLEDFKLPNVVSQGAEAFDKNAGILVYFAVLPKEQRRLSFNFFNTQKQKYEDLSLSIDVRMEQSSGADLRPKNSLLIFKNLALLALSSGLLILGVILFLRRKKSWGVLALLAAFLCAAYLVYVFFSQRHGVLVSGSKITILPLENSTILEQVADPQSVEIIGEYRDFYKVLTQSNKPGWAKKTEVNR